MQVGERIKQLRKKQGMSQVKLSDLSGVTQTTISTIEHGATPNVEIAGKLARALKVTIEDLLPRQEVKN